MIQVHRSVARESHCCFAVETVSFVSKGQLIQQKSNVLIESKQHMQTESHSLVFVFGATAPRGPRPPHSRGFQITHNDATQSVGLLWTSDQHVAETAT